MKSSTIWGLLFIAIGIILLLIIYSVIPIGFLSEVGKVLPLIFVAIFIVIGTILIFSKPESEIEEVKK